MTAVVVIAKECRPGHVKTRLVPAFTPEEAAALAAAALDDTLASVGAWPVARRVLFTDGAPPPLARGFDVIPQPDGGLDERLAHVFDLLDEPTLLLGMDTPQVRHSHVAAALAGLAGDGAGSPTGSADAGDGTSDALAPDAWLGPAADGGFWALAMRRPDGAAIRGVPMSRDDTGARQLAALEASGCSVGLLPELVDVDTAETATLVAASAPETRFARRLARMRLAEAAP